jgi:uncharacterized protein
MANGFAIVTGASSGIGLELARLAAQDRYDLLLAADTPFVQAEPQLRGSASTCKRWRRTCRASTASTAC